MPCPYDGFEEMNRDEEVEIKLERARRYLREKKLNGVLLSRRSNFAWITAGGDNHVSLGQAEGVAAVFLTGRQAYAVMSNIESPRLAAEELPPAFQLLDHPWHDPAARTRILGRLRKGRAASDTHLPDFLWLGEDWNALRYSLVASEVQRYRKLARDAALALEAAALAVKPGMTEHEAAADLAWLSMQKGMDPFVRLIAADERIRRFRHPIPTARKVRRMCMLVLCAERRGLVVAATRLVHFGKLSRDLERRHRAVCLVDAAMIAASEVGRPFREVLQVAERTYRAVGFDGEWKHHHQGGPTGYAGREFVVTAREKRAIQPCQPIAWNPSIAGTKSEDTILATERGPELLTRTGHWPMLEVKLGPRTLLRPAILVK
jgi:Xaa-Pro aminopeptidase